MLRLLAFSIPKKTSYSMVTYIVVRHNLLLGPFLRVFVVRITYGIRIHKAVNYEASRPSKISIIFHLPILLKILLFLWSLGLISWYLDVLMHNLMLNQWNLNINCISFKISWFLWLLFLLFIFLEMERLC